MPRKKIATQRGLTLIEMIVAMVVSVIVVLVVGIVLAEHHRSERMKPRVDTIREAFQDSLEKDLNE